MQKKPHWSHALLAPKSAPRTKRPRYIDEEGNELTPQQPKGPPPKSVATKVVPPPTNLGKPKIVAPPTHILKVAMPKPRIVPAIYQVEGLAKDIPASAIQQVRWCTVVKPPPAKAPTTLPASRPLHAIRPKQVPVKKPKLIAVKEEVADETKDLGSAEFLEELEELQGHQRVHAALQTVSQELAGVEEQYPATEAATGGDDGNFENDNSIAVTDPYQ